MRKFHKMPAVVKAVSMFSSGITSWAATKRYAEINGTDGLVLLFADTKVEDEDNYRFLEESAENIGVPLIKIADGRTPWQVMRDQKIIGNSRIDPCSKILKRKLLDRWQKKYCLPEVCDIIFGILWDESHRIERLMERREGWNCVAPLCDKPWISKTECLKWAKREGIEPPRMYPMGFAHANCGGFCIKAGKKSFALLWKHFPDRYLYNENEERELRKIVGDHTILRETINGEQVNLTLEDFRKRLEAGESFDEFDFGGCGCALPV